MAFAQCDHVFHTNINDKRVGQKLGTNPTYLNADCKIAFESNDEGVFAYIKITNSPPSKKGDQIMFMESNGTQYFYEYQKNSKELSYNNHTIALELDVHALEWLSNNTIVKVGVVSVIENKMYKYDLDATRQYEFRNILTCLVNELDHSKVSKKIVNPSSKPRYNNTNSNTIASNSNGTPKPKLNKSIPSTPKSGSTSNSQTNTPSINIGINSMLNMNMFSDTDSLINQVKKMLGNKLNGQISGMTPQIEALFNSSIGSNIDINAVMNGNSSSLHAALFGSNTSMGTVLSNTFAIPRTKILTYLPPNANPSKYSSKHELEREIVRCEGSIQKLQKKIAVNNSSNNLTANSKLNHEVNMYEEEIQNYLNQLKDLEE